VIAELVITNIWRHHVALRESSEQARTKGGASRRNDDVLAACAGIGSLVAVPPWQA
jgi:hypothetical protein